VLVHCRPRCDRSSACAPASALRKLLAPRVCHTLQAVEAHRTRTLKEVTKDMDSGHAGMPASEWNTKSTAQPSQHFVAPSGAAIGSPDQAPALNSFAEATGAEILSQCISHPEAAPGTVGWQWRCLAQGSGHEATPSHQSRKEPDAWPCRGTSCQRGPALGSEAALCMWAREPSLLSSA